MRKPFDKWSALRPKLIEYIAEQDNYWEQYAEDMAYYYKEYTKQFPEYFSKELQFCENNVWDDVYLEAYLYTDIVWNWKNYTIMLDYDLPRWRDPLDVNSGDFPSKIADILIRLWKESAQIENALNWEKVDFTFLNS